jgi:lipoate-protein ligase B
MTLSATHPARVPVDYQQAQRAQELLVRRRLRGELPDLLWLLEHPPTITWGSSGGLDNLLMSQEELRARGIALVPSGRGGDVTFHEPGQLVGYPIVDLRAPADRDLHKYLRSLEEALLVFLEGVAIHAHRIAGRTGIWLEGTPPRKIAAMGVRLKKWVTSHGFALNVENQLKGFGLIVPCGIRDGAVTSLARELGEQQQIVRWEDVVKSVHGGMEKALGRPLKVLIGREGLDAKL